MGLAIEVGYLADMLANDPEGAEWFEHALATANRILKAERLPTHVEPRAPVPGASRAALASFPYSTLHYLRRAYAHRVRDPQWIAAPVPEGMDPANDPEVDAQLTDFASHLLCHSDSEGFYLPIDMPDIVFSNEDDDLVGGMLGSSQRLRDELRLVAPALGIALVDGELADAEAARVNALAEAGGPMWHEVAAWIALFEAARLSVAHGTAIVFC